MHYYQFNIADFALHTSHLSLEEEATYRRLIDYYYDTEKPIPKETQQVIRRLRLGSSEDVLNIILNEFFTLEDDGWHNYRCDIEIKAYHLKAEASKRNGKKGGRPPKNKGQETQQVILANPEETKMKGNYKPITNNHKPITKSKKAFSKPALEEIQTYFHDLGSSTCLDDGERFKDHFDSNGWKIGGKTPMKDWNAAVRNWHKRNQEKINGKSFSNTATLTNLGDTDF